MGNTSHACSVSWSLVQGKSDSTKYNLSSGIRKLPFRECSFCLGSCSDSDYIPYQQVNQNFLDAAKAMWNTLKLPNVWRPCLYMYLSLALSLDIYEGMFYWVTDSKHGPKFSKVIPILVGNMSA